MVAPEVHELRVNPAPEPRTVVAQIVARRLALAELLSLKLVDPEMGVTTTNCGEAW